MIGREKCLEMAVDSGFEAIPESPEVFDCTEDEIEILINRAYAEGQKDMRERAAKVCDDWAANICEGYIRALEIEE